MAKGSNYGENNKTLSFRLHPAEIRQLQRLAHRHGGVGRAIQVAIEVLEARVRFKAKFHLKAMNTRVDLQTQYYPELPPKYASEPQDVITFNAPLRVSALIARHAVRYYDEANNAVLRACITQLLKIEDEYYFLDPAFRLDDVYDPDKTDDRL